MIQAEMELSWGDNVPYGEPSHCVYRILEGDREVVEGIGYSGIFIDSCRVSICFNYQAQVDKYPEEVSAKIYSFEAIREIVTIRIIDRIQKLIRKCEDEITQLMSSKITIKER